MPRSIEALEVKLSAAQATYDAFAAARSSFESSGKTQESEENLSEN